jgi:hypothetical protein
MRKFLLVAPMLMAACATAPAGTPVHGVTPGHKCETVGTDQFVGQRATAESGAAIMRVSHAAVLRWAPPGVMLTMDFREDRVTVHTGANGTITQIKCG